MRKSYHLNYKLLAFALVLTLSQLSLGIALAAPQISAKLITSNNAAIKVNDNDTQGGATILSGAVIETPPNVAATIQVGDLGSVEVSPGSIVVIDFSGNNIKVTIRKGCAALDANKGTTGSVVDTNGKAYTTNSEAEIGMPGDSDYQRVKTIKAETDGKMRRRLPVCGLVPPAGPVGGLTPVPAAAGAGLSGAAIGGIIAAVGGAIAIGAIIAGGSDPSPN